MNIPNEILIPVVALIFFLLGILISTLVKRIDIQTKNFTEFILELVENFVVANQDLLEKPYKDFLKKVQKWIETNIKIDLTEEQWEIINRKIAELYSKFKEELKKLEE